MGVIGLTANRKFQRLAQLLQSPAVARGVLELLWEPCYVCADPYVGTSVDIETICNWRGARGALTKALLEAGAPGAGFIEPWPDARGPEPEYQIHDFFEHAPKAVKDKSDRP